MLRLLISCRSSTSLLAAAILTATILGCGDGPPPMVGVFVKNPGEPYVLLQGFDYQAESEFLGLIPQHNGGFKGTERLGDAVTWPVLKANGRIVFQGVNLDYTKIYLLSDLQRNKNGLIQPDTGTVLIIPVVADNPPTYFIYGELLRNKYGGHCICGIGPDKKLQAWFFTYGG